MKEKIITIKVKDITSKQWSNLLLELNLVKKHGNRMVLTWICMHLNLKAL